MQKFNDRRQNNVSVFCDTSDWISKNRTLSDAVKDSTERQRLYLGDMEYDFPANPERKTPAKVIVSQKRTFEAAAGYAKNKRTCILNFASASNPGGGVVHGANAQEEGLCRCSTLYPCLNTKALWNGFYHPHRANKSALHNDDCIYTPDVYVVKTDTSSPERMEESDWYKVDVLTCAAPNLRENPSNKYNPFDGHAANDISEEALRALLEKRIRRIFQVAMTNGAEVLILGAFGCGAFKNPPEIVARVFKEVQNGFADRFETIEYAVYCGGRDMTNYEVFRKVLG